MFHTKMELTGTVVYKDPFLNNLSLACYFQICNTVLPYINLKIGQIQCQVRNELAQTFITFKLVNYLCDNIIINRISF